MDDGRLVVDHIDNIVVSTETHHNNFECPALSRCRDVSFG